MKNDKEKFFKQFGEHLRKIREQKGISLRELELRGDVDRHTLSKIENGKMNPSLYNLKRICEMMEISFEELFKDFN